MDKRKKSFLIACVIGDGYIYKDKKSKSCTLEIGHSIKQKDYLLYKANLLKKYTGKKCELKYKKLPSRTINKNYGPIQESETTRIFVTHKYFRVLKKWLYPNNSKKYINYIKYLDPLGLAIWYMDDGSTWVEKNRLNGHIMMEFHTFIPKEDAEFLIKYFIETWDIEFHLHKKTETQYNIRCYRKNSIKLANIIKPFIPDCMWYKISFIEFSYPRAHDILIKDDDIL